MYCGQKIIVIKNDSPKINKHLNNQVILRPLIHLYNNEIKTNNPRNREEYSVRKNTLKPTEYRISFLLENFSFFSMAWDTTMYIYKANIKNASISGYERINKVLEIVPVVINAKNNPSVIKFLSELIRFSNLNIKKNDNAKKIRLREQPRHLMAFTSE